jgi:hypothetical protein
MSLPALHISSGDGPVAAVSVDERNAVSYYQYVHGGLVEAGYLVIDDLDLVVYVNA